MRARTTLKSVTIAVLMALGASGQSQSPADPAPNAVQAGSYSIEATHTRTLFALSHLGFSTWYGEFTGATGSLVINPANLSATRLEVTLPTASVSTSNAKLDGELKSEQWLDAQHYPTMTFRSTRVVRTGAKTATITGDLTLHGVTRPVTLSAKFNGAGINPLSKAYTVGFEAEGDIKRSDFGVSAYVPMIGDQVHLIISAAFEKNPA